MHMIWHNNKPVAKGAMVFEASLQDLQNDLSWTFRGKKLAPLIGRERDKMRLPGKIDDFAPGHDPIDNLNEGSLTAFIESLPAAFGRPGNK